MSISIVWNLQKNKIIFYLNIDRIAHNTSNTIKIAIVHHADFKIQAQKSSIILILKAVQIKYITIQISNHIQANCKISHIPNHQLCFIT